MHGMQLCTSCQCDLVHRETRPLPGPPPPIASRLHYPSLQGSGWGWLGYNPETNALQIATTANQDPLQATTKLVPVLGVDVWEHAYVRLNRR